MLLSTGKECHPLGVEINYNESGRYSLFDSDLMEMQKTSFQHSTTINFILLPLFYSLLIKYHSPPIIEVFSTKLDL